MNKRNREIFGWKEYRFRTVFIIGLVFVVLGVFYFLFDSISNSDFSTSDITGQVVQDTGVISNNEEDFNEEVIIEEPVVESSTSTVESSVTVEEDEADTSAALESQTPVYTDFKEQCAYDVKHSQEDYDQYQSQISSLQTEYDVIKQEYESKIKELENQYNLQLNNKQSNLDEAKKGVETAKTNLDSVLNKCSNQFS